MKHSKIIYQFLSHAYMFFFLLSRFIVALWCFLFIQMEFVLSVTAQNTIYYLIIHLLTLKLIISIATVLPAICYLSVLYLKLAE